MVLRGREPVGFLAKYAILMLREFMRYIECVQFCILRISFTLQDNLNAPARVYKGGSQPWSRKNRQDSMILCRKSESNKIVLQYILVELIPKQTIRSDYQDTVF